MVPEVIPSLLNELPDAAVPSGWRKVSLGNIGRFSTSSVNKKEKPGELKVRLVNYMDVYRHRFISGRLELMTVTAPESQIERSQVQVGDILFTPSSETSDDIGHSAVVVTDLPNTLHSYHTVRLRPTVDGLLNLEFSGWFANAHSVLRQFARRSTGSTRFTLNLADFEEVEVLLPPIEEQRKIAAILSSVDDTIATTRKVIEQTKRVKEGLLQALMTRGIGHTRFKKTEIGEIPEEWRVSTIGAEFETQLGKMLNKKARTGPNQLPYLGNAQVQWGRVNLSDVPTMHFDDEDRQRFALNEGDLLICEGGEIGRAAIWRGELAECYFQKALHRLRPRSTYSPSFLLRYMRLAAATGRFSRFSARTSISHLTQEKLRRLPIPVPLPEEQEEINNVFDSIDQGLKRHERCKASMTSLKRGLMQDLLTGRVRVNTD